MALKEDVVATVAGPLIVDKENVAFDAGVYVWRHDFIVALEIAVDFEIGERDWRTIA